MPRSAAPKVVYVAAPRKKAPKKKPGIGRLRGHGDYTYDKPGPWGRIGSTTGAMIGSAMGSPYGLGKAGSAIGKKIGSYAHYIGKIFGSGDYVTSSGQVKHNTLVNDSQIPSFGGTKSEIRVRHREFLGDVISSSTIGAFSLQSYPINPGLNRSFPWLSSVCGASFQQYRLNGMVFEYRSMSADALNSTNTALGSVVMATDYDSADASFTNKQQMENTEFGVSCKPSSCMIHGIECARSQTSVNELYIRAFAVPTGKDPRLYDMGNFQIATVGCQAASVNLGELWVSYDVSLIKSIEQVPLFLATAAGYTPVSASPTVPLGTSQTLASDSIGLTFTANKVQFPYDTSVGTVYQMLLFYNLTSGAVTAPAVTAGNGMTILSSWAPAAGETASRLSVTVYCWISSAIGTPAALPYVNFANFTSGAVLQGALNVNQITGRQ